MDEVALVLFLAKCLFSFFIFYVQLRRVKWKEEFEVITEVLHSGFC